MVDESVLRSVRKYLQVVAENGIPVTRGVIFGSQVSGRTDEWSDIDVLVISTKFDGGWDRRNAFLLWELTVKADSRIEPMPVGERQWVEDDVNPVIEIARREGVEVALP